MSLSTNSYNLAQDTQESLFQLAFQGVSAISKEVAERFGQTYQPGELIFQEGDKGNQIFIILKGSVEVIKQERVLAQLLEGEIFGEMAILEEKPRSATIRALDEVELLALNKEQFQMIFQLHPTWTLQLLRGFALRIANCYRLLSH